jgi:hypothetical protein
MLRRYTQLALAATIGVITATARVTHGQQPPPPPPPDSASGAKSAVDVVRRASQRPWNDSRTMDLVQRATARRAQQLADTGLVDFQATARGYLTFLAQLGEGFTEPPKIVKADQLALQVYWRAPNLSKQIIEGRRDTLLLPTDINYHRDHLGIVQNNFPDIIRLGDGDEVLDVPHPLSASGLQEYDFTIADSLKIRLADRTIDVLEVRLRPKNDRLPRAVGAVYIDRSEGQVVRMAFSFTRAALRDKQLEDVSVVLENGIIGGRFWLPRRQEIEIRRTGSWLDYPARGIIRGRWEIGGYKVNSGLSPSFFAGPEIVRLSDEALKRYPFQGRVLDSLPPDVRAVTDDDVRRVQEEARSLVRAEALSRTRSTSLSARAVSDFARVNRVEGLALGAGLTRRVGGGISVSAGGRYGIADHAGKGRLAFNYQRASGAGLRLAGYRTYRDVGDEPEVSLVRNSIAAQEFGSDFTDYYDARGGSLGIDARPMRGLHPHLELAYETQRALSVHARPVTGRYEPTIAATPLREMRATLSVDRPTALSWFGTELRAHAEVRTARWQRQGLGAPGDPRPWREFARGALTLHVERPIDRQRLVLHTTAAGLVGPAIAPVQELAFAGGPVTGPGYDFHQFAARAIASQRVEWRVPAPFPSIPMGRFGRAGGGMTLAPFAQTLYVHHAGDNGSGREGWHPALGLGGLFFFDILRLDVARGLRDGRWTFGVDVNRDFWGVL